MPESEPQKKPDDLDSYYVKSAYVPQATKKPESAPEQEPPAAGTVAFCPTCGARVSGSPPKCPNGHLLPQAVAQVVEHSQRVAALDAEIRKYIASGFRVVSRTETTAQLVKPKKFSFWWAAFWTLALLVGLILYLFWYAAKKDETVYLEVDQFGQVNPVGASAQASVWTDPGIWHKKLG